MRIQFKALASTRDDEERQREMVENTAAHVCSVRGWDDGEYHQFMAAQTQRQKALEPWYPAEGQPSQWVLDAKLLTTNGLRLDPSGESRRDI